MNWKVEMRIGKIGELAVVDIELGNTFYQLIRPETYTLIYPLFKNKNIEQEALDQVQSYIDMGHNEPVCLTLINFNQTPIDHGIQKLTLNITDLEIKTPPTSDPKLTNGLIVLLGTDTNRNRSVLHHVPSKGEVIKI